MAYQILWAETGERFEAASGETVLQGALRAGVRLPHDCQFGGCGTCRIRVQEGELDYEEFPLGLTPEEAGAGYALACQARPHSDMVIGAATSMADTQQPVRVVVQIAQIRALSPTVVHLSLALPREHAIQFRPGQYLNVVLEDGSRRSFSMAAAAGGATLDLHIKRVPGGRFTGSGIDALRVGAPLEVEVPIGTFRYHEEDYRPIVMVATGTGLAPLKAILESLMDDPDCPPVSLYWGARTRNELYLHKQIEQWAPRLYDFRYVPVLSRADDAWTGRQGYVQQAVCADFDHLSEHAIYLCGSPAMIDDARQLFQRKGADIHHIYADSFTFQHEPEKLAAVR